jgi:hypothetical protein
MAENKGKHPGGRPTKYKPEYCQQLIDYMEEDGDPVKRPVVYEGQVIDNIVGYLPNFFVSFARKLGVSVDTIQEWKKVYPEFSAAYKKAQAIQLDKMVKGSIAGVYNSAGAIFALKNMFGWRDKQEIDTTVTFEPPKIILGGDE